MRVFSSNCVRSSSCKLKSQWLAGRAPGENVANGKVREHLIETGTLLFGCSLVIALEERRLVLADLIQMKT